MTDRTPSKASNPTLTSVQMPTTVGLDLSDRVSHYHVQRGDGVKLLEGKVGMTRAQLAKLFQDWKGCRLVIEAGGHSPWVSRLGTECGLEVVVANPRRVELITKSDRKTDRKDAKLLAELGRTNKDLLAPIRHRSQQAQADLAVLRSRDEVVRMRTALINHMRGVLKSYGLRAPKVSAAAFGARVVDSVPAELAAALQPILRLIAALNGEIKAFDKALEPLGAERYPVTQLLRQIVGVGPLVSLRFVLTLEDPARFANTRSVGSYLGLVPRKRSSGDANPQLRITKAGDGGMRQLLVLAACYILGPFGPDCDLRRFGFKLIGPGTDKRAKKRARVAVARKLAVLMLHLWRTGEAYDPLHLAKKLGEPLAV